jgi:hypothetical protein
MICLTALIGIWYVLSMNTDVGGQLDDREKSDWLQKSNKAYKAEESRHVREQRMNWSNDVVCFFWNRKSEGKEGSVQETGVDQFLKEEFDVSQFGILDA